MRELLLLFSVSDRLYAVRADVVREIIFVTAMSRLPGQPQVVDGFLNYRGETVAVVSLRYLFREPQAEPDLYAPVIVFRDRDRSVALFADEVLDVVDAGAV